MFARFSFVPTLVYNIVMEKCTNRRWYDRMDDRVVLGALPFRQTALCLIREEKIGGVVSMNEDYELFFCLGSKEWKELGVEFLQLSTVDIFSAPDQSKLLRGVEFIDKFSSSNRSVYVHCKAGRTRSATLVACYLMWRYDMTPNEAVSYIILKRPHILLHSKQWQAIRLFYKNYSPHSRNSMCS